MGYQNNMTYRRGDLASNHTQQKAHTSKHDPAPVIPEITKCFLAISITR